MQFLTDGAWTKRSHVGQAAQNGLNCATMAAEGFKGPSQAFEVSGVIYMHTLQEENKKSIRRFRK